MRRLKPLNGWMRAAAALTLVWAAAITAIAAYERVVVDPWTFIGENRGPIFFSWSTHLVYNGSPFGDFALVFNSQRFGAVLMLPIVALWLLAIAAPTIMRLIRRRPH